MTHDVDSRALAVLLRPSAAMLLAFVALIVWAGYLTVIEPGDLRGPYIVLLLCQSFAASTGYAVRGRRGHFDQLLAGRSTRTRFAVAHAFMSAALGGVAWSMVSLLDALGGGGHWPLGLTPKALVPFIYMSTVAWAASVPFSRYSAGVVWLVVSVALAGSGRLIAVRNSYVAANSGWAGLWHTTWPVLLFPPVAVGEASTPPAVVVILVLGVAVAALCAGTAFIARYGLDLEDVE
jgi:hypothetical protein